MLYRVDWAEGLGMGNLDPNLKTQAFRTLCASLRDFVHEAFFHDKPRFGDWGPTSTSQAP